MTSVSERRLTGIEHQDARLNEVWRQLDKVCDPELDESITDMGFVENVEIDGDNQVAVSFRLPTYWCSANFAYLMATDIRLEVKKLDWVSRTHVTLADHMFEDQVNTGVNQGLSFREIFADLAPDQSLDEIRETFRKKAFQRRQEVMLMALQGLGFANEQIVAMTIDAFDAVQFSDEEEIRQKSRYRDILELLGRMATLKDLAFRNYEGDSIGVGDLADYLSKLKSVRINMEFSGALCRGLLSTRYKELDANADEPTLIDFMLDRVPPNRSTAKHDSS